MKKIKGLLPKQYYKQYREDHKEEIKQYRENHKEEIAEKGKQYYENHKEEIAKKGKNKQLRQKEFDAQLMQMPPEKVLELMGFYEEEKKG